MVDVGNPAERLHHLLDALLSQRPATTSRVAWASVLGRDEGDLAGLLSAFAGVCRLPQDTRSWFGILSTRDEDVEEMSQDLAVVESALSTFGLHHHVEQYRGTLTPEVRKGIRLSAGAIRRAGGRDPDWAALEGLRIDVAQLRGTLLGIGELDDQIRVFALEYLGGLEGALSDLQIYGVTGLLDIQARLLGDLLLRWTAFDLDEPTRATERAMLGKLWDVVHRTASAATIGTALPQLSSGVETVVKMLGG